MAFAIIINADGYVTATWYCLSSKEVPAGHTEIDDERLFWEFHNGGLDIKGGGGLKWRAVDGQFIEQADIRRVIEADVSTPTAIIGDADCEVTFRALADGLLDPEFNDQLNMNFGSAMVPVQFVKGVGIAKIPTFGEFELSLNSGDGYRLAVGKTISVRK